MSDERLQTAHIRAVQASIAHEATHALAWKMPCRTCAALRAAIEHAVGALFTAAWNTEPTTKRRAWEEALRTLQDALVPPTPEGSDDAR